MLTAEQAAAVMAEWQAGGEPSAEVLSAAKQGQTDNSKCGWEVACSREETLPTVNSSGSRH